MKIGIDIQGVADRLPEFFAELSKPLCENNHEVHIITGARSQKITPKLKALVITSISRPPMLN